MVERFLRQLLRFAGAVLGWAWDRVWTEPVRSRGVEWTLCLWVHFACGWYFASIIVKSGQPFLIPLLVYYLTAWRMYKTARPKSLGRPLRYRRRR